MKHKLLCFLFFSLFYNPLLAQTGTIKIAKPAMKDTVVKTRRPVLFMIGAGGNYTFNKNVKYGFQAEMAYVVNTLSPRYNFRFGVEYSLQYKYFELSPYDNALKKRDVTYGKSQNTLEVLKMPFQINYKILLGANQGCTFYAAAIPEYLINSKNEYNRLSIKDFNQFNVAGAVGIRFGFLFKPISLSIRYSKDILQWLKDANKYDSSGNIVGKQNTRIGLLSVSLVYFIEVKR